MLSRTWFGSFYVSYDTFFLIKVVALIMFSGRMPIFGFAEAVLFIKM